MIDSKSSTCIISVSVFIRLQRVKCETTIQPGVSYIVQYKRVLCFSFYSIVTRSPKWHIASGLKIKSLSVFQYSFFLYCSFMVDLENHSYSSDTIQNQMFGLIICNGRIKQLETHCSVTECTTILTKQTANLTFLFISKAIQQLLTTTV